MKHTITLLLILASGFSYSQTTSLELGIIVQVDQLDGPYASFASRILYETEGLIYGKVGLGYKYEKKITRINAPDIYVPNIFQDIYAVGFRKDEIIMAIHVENVILQPHEFFVGLGIEHVFKEDRVFLRAGGNPLSEGIGGVEVENKWKVQVAGMFRLFSGSGNRKKRKSSTGCYSF